ncbi:MAG: type II secretion system protein [Haloferacaceae archaeon]
MAAVHGGLRNVFPMLFLVVAVALAVGYGVIRAPVWLATVRRTRALGAVPGLVTTAALRLRLEPAPERAARFAARTGSGPLARSLDRHVRAARGTARCGLEPFAEEWRPWYPELRRATALLVAGAGAPTEERGEHLDRAVEVVLDATRDRMAAFAGEIRGPASGIYAFGVVLPLALAGMLPAARVAGVEVSLWHVALLYDLVLPAGLAVAAGWLLTRRPVAFPPPRIDDAHPDVPDRRWRTLAAAGGGGLAGGLLALAAVAPWAAPLGAAGGGLGAGLVVHYRPAKRVREHVREVEAGLDDAVYLVGRRVEAGTAVERAVEGVAAEVPGATGAAFEDAAGVQRRLGVGVREAFLGEFGALAAVPSPRARSVAALLAVAASEGHPAGGALVALGDQLSALRRVEADARRELTTVTRTIANTGAVFGPLVAGATVAMAGRMGGVDGTEVGGSALPIAGLGLAVGIYVLLLAALLTALATGLDRGLDRVLLGYRLGFAIPAATAVYLVTEAAVAALL